MHAQFRRAKEKMDSPDSQLLMDISLVRRGDYCDQAVLQRLSEKLQLRTINDLTKEAAALNEMVISCGGDPDDCLEEMSTLLKKLNDSEIIENPVQENLENKRSLAKHRSPVIPDDFRCPISLELMKDPVIVSTGQVIHHTNLNIILLDLDNTDNDSHLFVRHMRDLAFRNGWMQGTKPVQRHNRICPTLLSPQILS